MKNVAPYQIFFPLGLFNALLAVGVWFVQDLGWLPTHAMLIHSKLIVGGFLWSFIIGFLMTAVPRMTGTTSANKIESFCALMLIVLLSFFSWRVDSRPFYFSHAILVIFLLVFAGRRLVQARKPVPVFFSHVVIAMLLALVGDFFHYQHHTTMGIHLSLVGTLLLLVLGIGTRFFSFLSGLPSAFENSESSWRRVMFHACGALVAVLVYCVGLGYSLAYLGLTAISLVYLFLVWQIQRCSERPSALKHGVRIVACLIPISFFLSWLQPQMHITWLHLLFIGCFGLLTFSVSTRVTLAHGSYPIDFEMKSKALWWMVILLVLSFLSRSLYGFTDDAWWKKSWLHFAGTFWSGAVCAWCFAFLKKIFVPGPQEKPSC